MWGLFRKLRGTAAVLWHLPGQRRFPFRSAEHVHAARDARVRETVRYAARTVPYYREVFPRLGIDPRDVRTAVDLDRLPLLDKDTVRRDPERFLSTSRRARGALEFVTSGSTGAPLRVYHDGGSLMANLAYRERERDVVCRALGRRGGYRIMTVAYRTSTAAWVSEFYRARTIAPGRPELVPVHVEDPLDQVIAKINETRPEVLASYGAYLEMLFRTVASRGLALHRPRLVMYGSEGMTEPGRRFIEERFGIPVYSWYNAVECFKIGFTCEARRGFHLHEDLCVLRLVDAGGRSVPAGQAGEVVISNLVDRATVLLNYRLGDVGVLATAPCPCGRSLRLLEELQGRVEDFVLLDDGRLLHPAAVWGVFKERPGVLRFQLVQHERRRFELRLTTADPAGFDAEAASLVDALRALLGPVTIEPVQVRTWEGHAQAKFRPVLSHCAVGAEPAPGSGGDGA
jgi:phenylacetate-CoA ligase